MLALFLLRGIKMKRDEKPPIALVTRSPDDDRKISSCSVLQGLARTNLQLAQRLRFYARSFSIRRHTLVLGNAPRRRPNERPTQNSETSAFYRCIGVHRDGGDPILVTDCPGGSLWSRWSQNRLPGHLSKAGLMAVRSFARWDKQERNFTAAKVAR
jgi:hypothetical protein